jgi:predicted transcriptional regulator
VAITHASTGCGGDSISVDGPFEASAALLAVTFRSISGLADNVSLIQLDLLERLSVEGDRSVVSPAQWIETGVSCRRREVAALEAAGWVQSHHEVNNDDAPRPISAHGRQLVRLIHSVRERLVA